MVGAQCNVTFGGWHEVQKKNTNSVKANGSQTSKSFDVVGNITSAS